MPSRPPSVRAVAITIRPSHMGTGGSVAPSPPLRTAGGRGGARRLWEDWDRARPFTFGQHCFNVGDTHDVVMAGVVFGSIENIPEDFDEWEHVARSHELNYLRGWAATDASQMFLWDDLDNVIRKPVQFEHLRQGLRRLQTMGYASPRTELWDRGGDRYLGSLMGLALLGRGRRSSQLAARLTSALETQPRRRGTKGAKTRRSERVNKRKCAERG
jgi:hypothetical protein